MSSSQLVFAWIAVGVTCLVVFVLAKRESVRQSKTVQREFQLKDLVLRLTDPGDANCVVQVCAQHRSVKCKECGVDFSSTNTTKKLPTHHTVLCCIKRKGLPQRCVEIIDGKTGAIVGDNDMVDGLRSEEETPDRMTRCEIQ